MIVDFILWSLFVSWLFVWMLTLYTVASLSRSQYREWEQNGKKYRYGVLDALGFLALIAIIFRYW